MGRTSRSQRLSYLRTLQGRNLLTSFRTDGRNAPFHAWIDGHTDEAAIDILLDRWRKADPTAKSTCTQWLMQLTVAGRLPAEDLPKARQTLEAFQTYKRRLPPEQRDLGRYAALGDVWAAVEPFVLADAPVSGKDEERREREAARGESDILLEQDGWIIAIPRTQRAACWWGRGTRWCTAAADGNMFDYYDKQGPLLVFVRPDGAKFQYHQETSQFMDASDCDEELADALAGLTERLPVLNPVLAAYLEFSRPVESEIWLEVIRRFGCSLRTARNIWDQSWTNGMAIEAVQSNGLNLGAIPKGLRTYDLVRTAIKNNGVALKDAPREMIDRSMCEEAVRQDPVAIRHAPRELIDTEMCIDIVRREGCLLQYIPRDLQTREVCAAAVSHVGYALGMVPEDLVDREMCMLAIETGYVFADDIPGSLRDQDMFVRLMQKAELRDCPEFSLIYLLPGGWTGSREVYIEAIKRAPFSIREVPSDLLDREMCLLSVQRDGLALCHVPERLRTDEVCQAAIRQNSMAFYHSPYKAILTDPETGDFLVVIHDDERSTAELECVP